ncbi:MAG: hypothetical protein U1C46_08480 [Bacteroidales bacterium]|nr:hypothetical protein [Bacteroidales bacterium]
MKSNYKTDCLVSILASFMFIAVTLNAQTGQEQVPSEPDRKNNIGFQFNPYLNERFIEGAISFDFNHVIWLGALRYGRRMDFHDKLTIGAEIYYLYSSSYYFKSKQFNIGPYFRYNLFSYKRLGLWGEFSPTLNYSEIKFDLSQTPAGHPFEDYSDVKFGYYIAPGINIKSENGRWSYDFMWKFSGKALIDGRKHTPSIKINFHF